MLATTALAAVSLATVSTAQFTRAPHAGPNNTFAVQLAYRGEANYHCNAGNVPLQVATFTQDNQCITLYNPIHAFQIGLTQKSRQVGIGPPLYASEQIGCQIAVYSDAACGGPKPDGTTSIGVVPDSTYSASVYGECYMSETAIRSALIYGNGC